MTTEAIILRQLVFARQLALAGALTSERGIAAQHVDTPAGRVVCTVEVRNYRGGCRYVCTWQLDGKRYGYKNICGKIREVFAARLRTQKRVRSVATDLDATGATLVVKTEVGTLRERFVYGATVNDTAAQLRKLADKLDAALQSCATLDAL